MAFLLLNSNRAKELLPQTPKETPTPNPVQSQEHAGTGSLAMQDKKGYEDIWYKVDQDAVYRVYPSENIKVEGADPATFEHIDGEGKYRDYFYKDKNKLYSVYIDNGLTGIENSDPESFRFLDSNYALDKNQAYFCSWTMGGIIVVVIPNIDADSFSVVTSHITKDKNHVYIADENGSRVISNADSATIEPLEYEYIKDKNHIFFGDLQLSELDTTSFKIISEYYIKDTKKVYYCVQLDNYICIDIPEADAFSFELLTYNGEIVLKDIGRDKNHIFNREELIENSSPDTFEKVSHYEAKDENNRYKLDCDSGACLYTVVNE